jgi:hypothetical protein
MRDEHFSWIFEQVRVGSAAFTRVVEQNKSGAPGHFHRLNALQRAVEGA